MSILQPGSPEWARKVTASKVAGILGLSPWDSPLTVWLTMHGDLDPQVDTDATRRGHYLEDGVLNWWLDQDNKHLEVKRQVQGTLGDWAAATPDMLAYDNDEYVLVDAKTAATDDHWGDDPEDVPAYYVASSLWQLACFPNIDRVHLAVLFGCPQLAFREYVVHRDQPTIDAITARCREFYDSLAGDVEPGLSGMACEYDAIRKAHPLIDRDATVVLDDQLIDDYLTDKAHEKRLAVTKARVLDAMGNARLAQDANGNTIARRQPKGDAVTLVQVATTPNLENAGAAA